MNFSHVYILICLGFIAFLPSACQAAELTATNSPDTNTLVRSEFAIPSTPSQGRDPFYPESIRLFTASLVTNGIVDSTLSIKGFSGAGQGRMVIINNHSFGVGDEGDVLTGGTRVHVTCLAINEHDVVIKADNQLRKLNF